MGDNRGSRLARVDSDSDRSDELALPLDADRPFSSSLLADANLASERVDRPVAEERANAQHATEL